MKKILPLLLIIIFTACGRQNTTQPLTGFWQGPHPSNPDKKFYVNIQSEDDSMKASGYWTLNNFYQSEFKIDSVGFSNDSISFYVPDWACYYSGKLIDENNIDGGFSCANEPFDKVGLIKNDAAAKYLTLPKADHAEHSKYNYNAPECQLDLIAAAPALSHNDTLFIESMVGEILDGNYGRINSLLIVKNNKLICEEYFFGYSRNDLHPIESSTKSISSLLLGIAKDQECLFDLDEPLCDIFTGYPHLKKTGYKDITIKHLLTMTSGFRVQDKELFNGIHNRISFALNRELLNPAGSKFAYDGGNTEILGAIIRQKTGMYADEFADKFLFKPLGINDYNWEIYKQDGYPSMAGSLWLKPIDMAKIGLLVLNKGKFAGKQIISEDWIRESSSKKVATHIKGDDYAYHWWNIHLESKGKFFNCIWANGWGSQFIYIIPELGVVIVTTGHNYENDSWAITAGIEKYLYLLD